MLQCLNLCILSAILLGILYLFFGAFPLVFQNNHGFSISQTGLSFLGLFVGMLIGIASDPVWKRSYDRLVRQQEAQGGGSEPEFRLTSTIFGAFLVPIALFGKLLHVFDVKTASNRDPCRVWLDHVFPCKPKDLIKWLLQIADIPGLAGALDRYGSVPHIAYCRVVIIADHMSCSSNNLLSHLWDWVRFPLLDMQVSSINNVLTAICDIASFGSIQECLPSWSKL